MNPIVLSKGLLTPSLQLPLFTIPSGIAYMYCFLYLTAQNGNGMAFQLWASLQAIPEPKDVYYNQPTPINNASGTAQNNLQLKNMFLGTGETLFIQTPQSDLYYRLTGYGVAAGPVVGAPSTVINIT